MNLLNNNVYNVESVEYVATKSNDETVTLYPRNCTWVSVEMTASELESLAIVDTLTNEELTCDFSVNNLF